MKKILTAIITASMMLFSAVPLTGMAEDTSNFIEIDGVYYEPFVNNDTQIRLRGVADKHATSITIHNEVDGKQVVIYASEHPFMNCPKLEEINIKDGKEDSWHSIDGVLFNGTKLISYPPYKAGDYTIPEGTDGVDQYAFWNTTRLEKLTTGSLPEDTYFNFIENCSITEFDGTGMSDCSFQFVGLDHLRKITLDGKISRLHIRDLPRLESVSFTPDALITGDVSVLECPSVEELRIAEFSGAGELRIENCGTLRKLSFYNGWFGLNAYDMNEYDELSTSTVRVMFCPVLREIEVLATPYVYSKHALYLHDCPLLERLTIYEMPRSAVTGEEDLPGFAPFYMQVGEQPTFTVYGRKENKRLMYYCDYQRVAFEALPDGEEPGDVNDDSAVNASDAAMILIASAKTGAGGLLPLSVTQTAAADVNGDGKVNASDAALILQYAAAHGSGAFKGTIKEFLSAR